MTIETSLVNNILVTKNVDTSLVNNVKMAKMTNLMFYICYHNFGLP